MGSEWDKERGVFFFYNSVTNRGSSSGPLSDQTELCSIGWQRAGWKEFLSGIVPTGGWGWIWNITSSWSRKLQQLKNGQYPRSSKKL